VQSRLAGKQSDFLQLDLVVQSQHFEVFDHSPIEPVRKLQCGLQICAQRAIGYIKSSYSITETG